MVKQHISAPQLVVTLAILLFSGACAPEMVPPPDPTVVLPGTSSENEPVTPTEISPKGEITPGSETFPRITPAPGTALPPDRPGGPSTDILEVTEPVRLYIASALGLSPEEVVMASYEAVEWSDGCLGISQPGMVCPMKVTPGYLVTFDTPQGQIEAHLDRSGRHFRTIPDLGQSGEIPPAQPPKTSGYSGIRGQVLLGPACPGPVIEDSPCPDKPFQATLSVLNLNGEEVLRFQTDSEGFFQVELPPGKYILHPESPDKLPFGIDQTIIVLPGKILELQVHYESGLR